MFNDKGQSLMELVVVLAVMIFVISALTFATIASLRNAQFSQNQAQATKLAQEGMERVRTSRDRNANINLIPNSSDCPNVDSWNGKTSGSTSGAIWSCKIYNTCGSGGNCYLNFVSSLNNNPAYNDLRYLTTTLKMPLGAEAISYPPSTAMFQRIIILSDDSSTYSIQKSVTVVVAWTDFSGPHESRLTTILRKI